MAIRVCYDMEHGCLALVNGCTTQITLFELLIADHAVPHHAVCHVTCVLTCIHEMPMHLACACARILTAVPPPQVRPTDPAYREPDEMPTVTQTVMWLQV